MKRIFLDSRVSLVLSFLLFFTNQHIFSQSFFGQPYQHIHDEKCAAVFLEKVQEEELGIYGTREYFETWLSGKIQEAESRPPSVLRIQQDPKIIPVVVHVIHNGTALGEGANIPQAQIEAQIRILTEDYRRLNPDAGLTPTEFLDVATDTHIEFVLAKQDPRGLPTNGINRVQGTKSSYNPSDAALISELALWDPDVYLNIWVVPLVSPFIGYASFPIAEIPGLNFPANTRETDGVTVDYRYFGEGGNAVSGSGGRTATHEVGHFLGLRHTWGDGDCSVDDFVADTPNQDSPNNSCRLDNPRFSCDSRDMVENYMDYTPDACMNLFTVGQQERMDAILEFSPRRASLVNNRATVEPQLINNDLGFERILDPQDFICSDLIVPTFEIFNSGLNLITSARIEIRNNGVVLQTKTFELNLTTGQSALVSFDPVTLPTNESNEFEANILRVNNNTDNNQANNQVSSTPTAQPLITLPYVYESSDFNSLWTIKNPDNSLTWEQIPLNISGTSQNTIRIRHYEYDAAGQVDYFISPQLNLSDYPNAQLTFNMAYAPYEANDFGDFLYVAISTDCGNTFDLLEAPYDKGSDFLQTSTATLDEFIPTTESQFRREIVNLSEYQDEGNIRIAFITRNGYGNNIFIKDIEILTEETYLYSIKLEELVSPTPITNGEHEQEVIAITNDGNLPISGFMFTRRTNGSAAQTFLARGLSLPPGEMSNITLPNSTREGLNTLMYSLSAPNFDQNDASSSDLTRYVIQDMERIFAPWRQDFNNITALEPWLSLNPENNSESWSLTSLQVGSAGNNAVAVDIQAGMNSYWLGSPIFDLSGSRQASIFFDRAVGNITPSTTLKVLASDDGGVSYEEVYRKSGEDLSTVSAPEANPNTPTDYVRDYVNLTDFAGEGRTKTRLAFVLENGSVTNGSIYLDNIELFLSANPEPVDPGLGSTVIYPNPAREVFNIAFNFRSFETVNIQIFSSTGALVQDVDYPNTLNQTYSFSSQLFSKGMFIVKITSNTLTETRKVIFH
jgi:hypothetical protein